MLAAIRRVSSRVDDLLSIHSLKQAAAQPVHDRVENNSAKRAGAYHHGHKY
jgi:hypothetical protein